MKDSIALRLCVVLLGAILAGPAIDAQAQEQDSGFLRDYSRLHDAKDANGVVVRGWANPRFTPENYGAIMIDPLTFYPEPRPTEHVSAQALQEILAYSNEVLKQALDGRFKVVDSPAPGVARLRIAISGVGAKAEGLKPYQLLPLAFVATAVKRAASGAPQRAFVLIETEASDSVSGELMGLRVRVGTGERLAKIADQDTITLETVKPLLDELAGRAFPDLSKYVKPE